ncbi:GNAT family N-acetyltransferase [uncultured Tateyamaria sp.]|uniref:GNAT family N-acetyltransferase n=1 Tax=uncultured Tateyamaria sp. TaxID=455651 RepID=UPI00263678BE|nr:GNAT family N-acetyltransferase [uncultured Tateyamaria sp.]
MFSYRLLGIEDAQAWLVLRQEGATIAPSGFLVTEAESRAMTVEMASNVLAYGGLRGVFDDDALVGFCGYRPQRTERTRHRAELGPFYVTPDFQGTGAAQAMMRGVLDEARVGGVVQIELSVAPENTRAIAFYERQGYEQFGVLPDAIRENGTSEDALLYRLQLA